MPEFVYFVRPKRSSFPGDATSEELAIVGEHTTFLKEKLDSKELILVGRTQDDEPVGICVFEAEDMEDALSFARSDPAVTRGVFSEEVRPYSVFLMRGRD